MKKLKGDEMSKYPKIGELVVPGQKISSIEAFSPGKNAYRENGYVYSATVGNVLKDMKKRVIWVYPRKENPNLTATGDIVIGQVVDIKEKTARVKIIGKIKPKRVLFKNTFTGEIYIANTSKEYVESMIQIFGVGDMIKCKVVGSTSYGLILETKGENLGVVYSKCTNCGASLKLKVKGKEKILYCYGCHKTFRGKKIASDYGRTVLFK